MPTKTTIHTLSPTSVAGGGTKPSIGASIYHWITQPKKK